MGLADIHNHMMPGVDDGSKDMDMTKRMIAIAYKEGIDTVILTPHYKSGYMHVEPDDIRRCAEELTEYSEANDTPITFYPGNEILYYSETIERLDQGKISTLAGSSYVLVEFDPLDSQDYIMHGLKDISYAGYNPVLAHIERYNAIVNAKYAYEDILNLGVCIQVNAGSVMGRFGREAKGYTKRLLKEHAVQFVATDAHRDEGRAPYMKDVSNYLYKKCGSQYADELLIDNAHKIIDDIDIL